MVSLVSALGGVTSLEIKPSDTDSQIGAAFNSPHGVYLDRSIVTEKGNKAARDRHELLVFLPGTNGTGTGAVAFCEFAASLGYHVINLSYPDEIAASVCAGDPNPAAFEQFRLAVIAGGQSKHISISRTDSIENRLIKALEYLQQKRPDEGWSHFLNPDGTLNWPAMAMAGQSQGGGHAALIGIKHQVARVICTGAPKDYSKRLDAPAAWYNETSATPKACFFTFNHRQDIKACTPEQLLQNLAALKLDAFGHSVDPAKENFPYRHTRILLTSFPEVTIDGPNSKGAKQAHNSMLASAHADRWEKAWTYLLTEETNVAVK